MYNFFYQHWRSMRCIHHILMCGIIEFTWRCQCSRGVCFNIVYRWRTTLLEAERLILINICVWLNMEKRNLYPNYLCFVYCSDRFGQLFWGGWDWVVCNIKMWKHTHFNLPVFVVDSSRSKIRAIWLACV